jgi:hypothetical protein
MVVGATLPHTSWATVTDFEKSSWFENAGGRRGRG